MLEYLEGRIFGGSFPELHAPEPVCRTQRLGRSSAVAAGVAVVGRHMAAELDRRIGFVARIVAAVHHIGSVVLQDLPAVARDIDQGLAD